MKTTEFMARYHVTGYAEHLADVPADPGTGTAARRRFAVTFTFPGRNGTPRTATFLHDTAAAETADDLCLADALWTVSETAFYGQSYDDLVDQFGPDVPITREQWEQGEHTTRVRCEFWITDLRMWERFLHLEHDTDESTHDLAPAP